MIDALSATDGLEQLQNIAAIMALLFALGALAVGARVMLLNITGERVARALRKDLFSAMLRQDTSFFDARSTGELVNRLSADASAVARTLTDNVARGIRASITTLSATGFLVYLSPQLTTVSLCMVPAFAAGVALFGRYARRLSRQLLDALAAANQVAAERIAAIRTVRLFAAEKLEVARYGRRIDDTYEIARRVAVIEGIYMSAGFLTAQTSLLGVLWYGGTMVYHGSMTVGALTSFAMYAVNLGVGVTSLSSAVGQLVRAQGAAARIFEVLDRESCDAASTPSVSSTVDLANAVMSSTSFESDQVESIRQENLRSSGKYPGGDRERSHTFLADQGRAPEVTISSLKRSSRDGIILPVGYAPPAIEYDHVHFAYPTRPEMPVLRGFQLVIEPGELCALVGGSGSGKSTLHMLLARLYDPDRGEVRFAGHELRKLDASWLRRQIGIVQQEPVLFAGTIAANIAYGRDAQRFPPEQSDVTAAVSAVDSKELQQVAEAAGAHAFISQLPAGYQTCIGERGAGLSGGQIQRIAIARALFHQPSTLALDEFTSALDLETELQVLDNLLQVIRQRRLTALVITHRVPIMKAADRVAVLAGGVCAEHGPFTTLIQNPRGMLPKMLLSDQELVRPGQLPSNRASVVTGTA
jgi:putative ABC transport system ATP-binding protein/ATP-binding cassette subfamily B (MDR/TAP) protein 10